MNGDDMTGGVQSWDSGLFQVVSEISDITLMTLPELSALFTSQNLKQRFSYIKKLKNTQSIEEF